MMADIVRNFLPGELRVPPATVLPVNNRDGSTLFFTTEAAQDLEKANDFLPGELGGAIRYGPASQLPIRTHPIFFASTVSEFREISSLVNLGCT